MKSTGLYLLLQQGGRIGITQAHAHLAVSVIAPPAVAVGRLPHFRWGCHFDLQLGGVQIGLGLGQYLLHLGHHL